MMSKSLTFYLLNHYQGVIILVCVCVCDMYLYIFVIQLYYGYKLVTFNITNFDFSICLSRKLYRGLHGISPLFRYAYSLQQKFDLLIYFRVLTIQNLDFSLNFWS